MLIAAVEVLAIMFAVDKSGESVHFSWEKSKKKKSSHLGKSCFFLMSSHYWLSSDQLFLHQLSSRFLHFSLVCQFVVLSTFLTFLRTIFCRKNPPIILQITHNRCVILIDALKSQKAATERPVKCQNMNVCTLTGDSSILCHQMSVVCQFTNREWQEKQLSRANPNACGQELRKRRANVRSQEIMNGALSVVHSQPAADQSEPRICRTLRDQKSLVRGCLFAFRNIIRRSCRQQLHFEKAN